jgi:hypothetical protein
MITYNLLRPGVYEILYENGVKVGEFIIGDDGYYGFWPELRPGYWTEYILQALATKLGELNKPYDDQVKEYFDSTN